MSGVKKSGVEWSAVEMFERSRVEWRVELSEVKRGWSGESVNGWE